MTIGGLDLMLNMIRRVTIHPGDPENFGFYAVTGARDILLLHGSFPDPKPYVNKLT